MLSDSEKLERLFELYEKKMYAAAFGFYRMWDRLRMRCRMHLFG